MADAGYCHDQFEKTTGFLYLAWLAVGNIAQAVQAPSKKLFSFLLCLYLQKRSVLKVEVLRL